MYYYVYQITNLVNGKIYIGAHKTKNLDDGYMGSGKILAAAQQKYGLENFQKDILNYFESIEEMFKYESEIVNAEFLLQKNSYNLKQGGRGGWDHVHIDDSLYALARARGALKSVTERKGIFSEEAERKRKVYYKTKAAKENQKKASEAARRPEAIAKRKETFKKIGHSKKEKNSQFGTVWITDGIENKKIKKDDLLPVGWKKGRTF